MAKQQTERTLGEAAAAGANQISVHCAPCWYSKTFPIEQALTLWKPELRFSEIAQHAKCSRCRKQATAAAAQWPGVSDTPNAPSTKPDEWKDLETRNPNRGYDLKKGRWD